MDKDFICALCLQFETDNPDTDYFVTTECGHVYHHDCIKYSYETGYRECPVDRKEIDLVSLRRIYASEMRGKYGRSQNNPFSQTHSETLEYDYKFKIVLVGDSSVGKSCLMQRYTDDHFSLNGASTIGCDWRLKSLTIGGKSIALSIWDTVGQEKYRSLISNYFREAHGCLLVYDITREDSIESIEDWFSYVKKFALSDTVMVLVGNKTDLETDRKITKEAGKKIAAKLHLPFFETSAKETYNVDAAFRCLAASILENTNLIKTVELKMKSPNIQLNNKLNEREETLVRNACSQSWSFTKSKFSTAARNVRVGWEFVTTKTRTQTNDHSQNSPS